MSKPARKKTVVLNWKKYERKASIKLQAVPKKKKLKQVRNKSQIALGITAIFFLVALILIGKLLGFLGGLTQTHITNYQPKLYSWDGSSDLNIVVKMDTSYLMSYQPNGKELTIFKFPADLYMDAPYNFGKWPMRSIYDLGQAEKPPMGPTLLRDTINTSFDLLADGYLIFSSASDNLPDLIERERKSLLPGIDLLSKTKTDLNIMEFLKVWWAIKEVRTDKIKNIDLEKSDLTRWLLLPDGSRVISLDEVKLDAFEQGFFETEKIKKEGLSIGIFNATDIPGLAERAARIITNTGGRVIFTSNAPDIVEKSTILAKKSYTKDYLLKNLNLYCQKPKNSSVLQKVPFFGSGGDECISDNVSLDATRADVTIILGQDTFLKYQK